VGQFAPKMVGHYRRFFHTRLLLALLLLCNSTLISLAQSEPEQQVIPNPKITEKYIAVVTKKSDKISADIDKQTEKYLNRLQKQEEKLQKKLAKIDSLAAHNVFADAGAKYQELQNGIKSKSEKLLRGTGMYIPWLDTASSSLKFLQTNQLTGKLPVNAAQITGALNKVRELENQLKQAENIKQFIRERKDYLRQQLSRYDLGSGLKNYSKEAYYYTQQINEYKAALDDPEKMERKALSLLMKIPAFEKFMSEHSFLAGLFTIPEDYATNMAGLQTQSQVQDILQSRFTTMGPNAQADVQQSLGAAQSELTKLRNQFPSSGSTGDLPDFKPKEQKTKTFLQRLEYGTNLQTVRSNYFFPTTTDLALSVGYKLSDKNIAGIGASYKMGWGKDIRHIAISSEGIGFRSFIDINLKKSFYLSGGFEYNYQQPFYTIYQINNLNKWQQSGLLGISKIVSLKTKFFKKTKLQVLWDMLSYRQIPQTQAIKFRVGYSF
jgi:predicted metal-dependent hydrolase